MGRGEKFLTNVVFDKNHLLSKLNSSITNSNNEKKQILENIIAEIKNENSVFLTSQEINWMKKNNSKLWVEYLIYRYNFKNFSIKRKLSNVPPHLLIEPVSACNLRCTMCFQVDKTFSSNSEFMGMMKFDLFKKIIDDAVNNSIHAITMASRGEPTLHPEFGKMLNYCKGKFFELKINSNATKLSKELIHSILTNDVTEMVFSVDSYTKENYEKIRVGGIFEQILDNIQEFKKIRDNEFPNSKCVTRVSGVKISDEQDPKKFKEFWEKYVDEVVMVNMKHRWDTYHNQKEIMGNGPCHILWEKMYIWYDGTCNPCDEDYKSELKIGSILEKSIKELWNSNEYKLLRQKHSTGKRDTCFPCDRCPNGS
jgi:radical SAM protein with 4Fe4S-binding SPASM domain